MKDILYFFNVQERILKNAFLIHLIYAFFIPGKVIKLGTTINKINPKTLDYLVKEGKKPKTALYDVVAIFQRPNIMKIGLKFEEMEPIWELNYNTGCISPKDIVNNIFEKFSIHPAKTENCFKGQNIPEAFKIYLQKYDCPHLWKSGIGHHKLFSLGSKEISLSGINTDEIEKYNALLENVLKKYQTFAKILMRLLTKSTYSMSNSCESFILNYNYELDSIHIQYRNNDENKCIITLVNVTDFNPTNMDKIDVPLIRLTF